MQDQNVGTVLLNIKIDGSVKWKVGTWIYGKYHLIVNCPAYMKFGDCNNSGNAVGPVMKFEWWCKSEEVEATVAEAMGTGICGLWAGRWCLLQLVVVVEVIGIQRGQSKRQWC
ncbi:NDR1/HIN1-like protein 1 [Fagus crenata]